ncbi:MAG: aldo/keto reductase [Desulforhabdus sp.]|jgi:predicted aldo/keto reductase-like oxidoreductase|nr:aldo/keto reductase [Desulforhabdus sp.]
MPNDEKGLSRRDFLKAAGTAGAGSVLAAAGSLAQSRANASESEPEITQVPKRAFGKTGVDVSILSLGGMFDISSNQLMLRQALKWGVTYWDTADCYEGGNSELGIGQYFKRYPDTRKEVFLVTKSDSRDVEGMTQLLERSLERMSTNYIDLYFIHGMRSIDEIGTATKAWAEKAKSAGKIKFFGFSTHSNMEQLMMDAAKLGWIDGIMMSYNFRLMQTDKMKAAVEACAKAGIGLTAMKTQGGSWISRVLESELELTDRFIKLGYTDKQAKLKAVWENTDIASICSQMPNMSILTTNIAAAINRTRLSAKELNLLEHYARETASDYCAGCTAICEPCLASSVPIGDIMRYYMYYQSYGDHDLARALFAEIDQTTRDRLLSLDYSEAERKCPQRIKIARRIEEATIVLG